MTKDEWWYVRESAAVALGKIGTKSNVAIPALVPLQQHDPNEDVRNAAAEAIGSIRSGSKE
jgi:HEAT repeat protein